MKQIRTLPTAAEIAREEADLDDAERLRSRPVVAVKAASPEEAAALIQKLRVFLGLAVDVEPCTPTRPRE